LTIANAHIQFNENGTPYATQFKDLYFSDAKGLEETTHVFVKNNYLRERWQNWQGAKFVIAETGFGTGLNILVTLDHFEQLRQKNGLNFRLHFISIEKFPIRLADLTRTLALYPQLKKYSQALLEQYPSPTEGCHRMSFLGGAAILDLWLGDVQKVLPKIENKANGLVDAWFLDGFSPSKNPDMWTQSLFDNMATLSKDHCHFATFTAAGHVKRGLKDAGFEVTKQPGHGLKKDMLAGSFNRTITTPSSRPYFIRHEAKIHKQNPEIAIVGGGLAAANCAYAFHKRGYNTTVYCKDKGLAQGASGNSQGGFYPQLNAEAGYASQIHACAFSYASALYRQLLSAGSDFSHQWCGTLQIAFNDKVTERYQKMVNNQTWPESLIHWVDSQQASKLANIHLPYSGLFIPQGGWVHLPELIHVLINVSDTKVVTHSHLTSLEQQNGQWLLNWQDSSHSKADIVILATGSDSPTISQMSELPFRLVRGQVEMIPSSQELANLSTVLCHKGYLTPQWQGTHVMGSTYVKNDTEIDYRESEQQLNIQMQQKALQNCDWVHQLKQAGQGRAGIRCSTPDHLPMVGAVANIAHQATQYKDLYKALPAAYYPQAVDHKNLYMLTGLGSRGLTTAPLCAEIVTSQILNEPLPLPKVLLDALNPNRFLIKSLIRRQPIGRKR
jgi:tRNA 5-methylaminomethyl-2-thiouridine biosynthesis bifunctional protein